MEESDLSQQEREKLMEVMEKAREFDEVNKEGRLQQQAPTEGQLYKWTNPLKGWQPRYFYVNQIQGVLHYCMSEEKKKLPPRASLHLWGAVVSPSDEDSQSFTIQGTNNECYRLKAANAKERQVWVSKMRMEVERANTLLSGSKELAPQDKVTASASLNSPSSTSQSAEPTPQKTTNYKKHSRKSQLSAPSLNLSLTKLTGKKKYHKKPIVSGGEGTTGVSGSVGFPGGEDMLDAFTRLQMLQDTLAEQLETSVSDAGTTIDNKNVLLLKATSRAAVSSVQDCLAILTPPSLPVYTSESPVHHDNNGGIALNRTQSPSNNPSSPSRRLPLSKHKRPMSMIDTSSRHRSNSNQIEDDLDDIVRSSSTSEVHGDNRHRGIVQKRLSKEAP